MRTNPTSTELDNALLALADPTRRRILEHLGQGELRITEIASRFPISLNSVSKHIKLLERGDLVTRRVIGREHILCINQRSLDHIQNWITSRRLLWQSNLQAIENMLNDKAKSPVSSNKRKKRHAKND